MINGLEKVRRTSDVPFLSLPIVRYTQASSKDNLSQAVAPSLLSKILNGLKSFLSKLFCGLCSKPAEEKVAVIPQSETKTPKKTTTHDFDTYNEGWTYLWKNLSEAFSGKNPQLQTLAHENLYSSFGFKNGEENDAPIKQKVEAEAKKRHFKSLEDWESQLSSTPMQERIPLWLYKQATILANTYNQSFQFHIVNATKNQDETISCDYKTVQIDPDTGAKEIVPLVFFLESELYWIYFTKNPIGKI